LPFIIIDHGHPAISNYQHKIPKGTQSVNKSTPAKKVKKQTDNNQQQPVSQSSNPYLKPNTKPHRVYLAKDLMSEPVISLEKQTASIKTAWEIMQRHNIKHLPITQSGKLIGIISDRDILKSLAFKGGTKENWFINKVYAATQDTDIHQLTHTMFDHHIGSMPIINEEQGLIGLITRSDILKLTSRYGPMEFWA